MPVKLDPILVEELAAMDLTIWSAAYRRNMVFNPKTGKTSSREDKSWITVALAGPGIDEQWGGGKTLREAVDAAMVPHLVDRVPGLRGALLRLKIALSALTSAVMIRRFNENRPEGEEWDDVPF